MKKYNYKLGHHRGGRRVWIEGKRLTAAGFDRGVRYEKLVQTNKITLTASDVGRFGVAGTDSRPIIDISGQAVAAIFAGHDRVNVIFQAGRITITGGEKA
jgi:DNA (cytosine-5)-methyltransferase 1